MLSRHRPTEPSWRTEVLLSRFALRIIHLELPAGESIASRSASWDAALVVVHGDGVVTVESGEVPVCAGSVVGLVPGEMHAVHAQSALGVLLIQTPADVVRQHEYQSFAPPPFSD